MAMFAIAAFSAVSQVMAGQAANKQAKINASMYEQQAGFIDVQKELESKGFDIQKDIELAKYTRAKAQMKSTVIAGTAKAGLDFGGSPMAVLVDNLTQMGIDEQITKYNYDMAKISNEYNLEQKKIGMLSEASQLRFQGKTARNQAYSNAFSTLMKGAYTSGVNKGWIKTSTSGKTDPTKAGEL